MARARDRRRLAENGGHDYDSLKSFLARIFGWLNMRMAGTEGALLALRQNILSRKRFDAILLRAPRFTTFRS